MRPSPLMKRSVAVVSLALWVAACGQGSPGDNATVGQRVDQAVERSREAAREVGEGGREAAREARSAVMGAASGTRETASQPGAQAGSRVDDAQVTARVNAALAADKELQALRIDVDTQDGVVTLKGQAPSMTAKARAGDLARNVKEAKSVRNELTVPAR